MKKISEPIKPNKRIEASGGKTFYFDHVSNKVSLLYFLDWLKEEIPQDAFDVTISIQEDISDYDGDIVACNILVLWKHMIENTRYKSEMKKYEKQLERWKKQNAKS